MLVFKAPLLLRLAAEDFVVSVRVERRIDVDEVDAAGRKLPQLVEVVAAVDDAGVDDGGWFGGHAAEISDYMLGRQGSSCLCAPSNH